jgi:two-component system, chemotaxis family, chemotaxis protein CheY
MEQNEKEKKNPTGTSLGQGKSRRVLVVDDNRDIRTVLSQMLRFMGFDVALAGNGIEALAVFHESSFDLVVTDLQMPIMEGSELAQLVKERSPKTPVILLTGTDRETVWKKVTKGSIHSVIFKPFQLNEFQSTVQGALASRQGERGSLGVG